MKNFVFGVFVWFLAQLVLVSVGTNINSVMVLNGAQTKEEACRINHSFMAGVGGLLMPILMFDFIDGDFCWNDPEINPNNFKLTCQGHQVKE